MKRQLKFTLSLFILISILVSCDKNSNSSNSNNSSTETKPVIKNDKVGKYTFSYSEVKGQVVVMYDGKGVNIGNNNVSYEDLLVVSTFALTINKIEGFDDIDISTLGKQIKNMNTSGELIRLKGKNCLYEIKFVTGGGYITDFVYNKCN